MGNHYARPPEGVVVTSYEQLAETVSAPSPRECDCPEWVVRCVHHNGGLLILWERALLPEAHRIPCRKNGAAFGVWQVPPQFYYWEPCQTCGTPQCGMAGTGPHPFVVRESSEADALAAFFEAERRLLDGE